MLRFAPITLFVYNRLEHAKKTVESLLANDIAKESILVIYSDGPKNIHEREQIETVRKYIRSIKGFRKVHIIERQKNYGLADNIISGVSEIVNKYGKIIVLEDDLVLSPHFLEYMNDALRKYFSCEKVMQISGYMYPIKIHTYEDAFFLPFTESWSWGTWKRAWKTFDPNVDRSPLFQKNKRRKWEFNIQGAFDYARMLSDYFAGKNNSWAVRWHAHVFFRKGIVLFPKISLVENQGFDNTGTHTRLNPLYTQPLDKDFRVEKYPVSCRVVSHYSEITRELKGFFDQQRTVSFKVFDMITRFKRHFIEVCIKKGNNREFN